MLIENEIKNNRYIVKECIGCGGSSRVYLAIDRNIGKRWALKEIDNGLMAHTLASREITMLKSIDYPMFPRIVDAWQEGNTLYIVSDYVEGISMDKILSLGGVSKRQAYKWSVDILDALIYLHGLSPPILYLDLKPENILVKPNGEVSMVDFGIAGQITMKAMPLGTPGYAAPEQYECNNDNISPRTDIFSYGMTYYSMRKGRAPNSNLDDFYRELYKDNYLSHKEKTFLKQCTMTEPSGRFCSADAVKAQLKRINEYPYKLQIIRVIGLIAAIAILVMFGYQKVRNLNYKKEAAMQMVESANQYIEDGYYTIEGIKIITTFINSGSLDEEVSDKFTYEVALTYFEAIHDYNAAYYYFSKLDQGKHPEASYLMELSLMQTQLCPNKERAISNLEKLYGHVSAEPASKIKYENELFIAELFVQYTDDQIDGIKKAITVLEGGMNEINSSSTALTEYEKDILVQKYDGKINDLYARAEKIQKGCSNEYNI